VKQKSGVDEHPSVIEVTPSTALESGVFKYHEII